MCARLTVHDAGDVIVIDACGRIASGKGRHSLRLLLQRLSENGHPQILLKISGIPSLDAADIGELMAGYAAVVLAGGELKLLNPRYRVEDALRTTRINLLLSTYLDELSALRSFTDTQPAPASVAPRFAHPSEWYYG